MLRSRRRLVGPLGVLAGLAIAFPLGVLAAVSFADVPPGHPFYFDIQAVAEKGVTTGCGGGNYCPDQNVTRGQMAAFMNRLGALAPDKTPVVNADKLDGIDSTGFLRPTGRVLITTGFGEWHPFNSADPLTFANYSGSTQVLRSSTGGNFLSVQPSIPTALYGKRLRLDAVEFCYEASASAVLDLVEINTFTHASAPGTRDQRFVDSTNRTDSACRLYSLATPFLLDTNDGVNFFARVDWVTAPSTFGIGRTTFVLTATNSPASAPASTVTGPSKSDTSIDSSAP